MACPLNSNTGFIQLSGVNSTQLGIATVQDSPISLSFGPRSTPPSFINGNHIDMDESTSCTYMGNRYDLIDAQVCKVIHTGYNTLLSIRDEPVGELILSFKTKSSTDVSGILLCLLIYSSGTPNDHYLSQLVENDSALLTCNYTINDSGKYYEINNTTPQTMNNSIDCLKTCCQDATCYAYNYDNDQRSCYLLNQNPPALTPSLSASMISGSINRNSPAKCASYPNNPDAPVITFESIFFGDEVQSSISYLSCIELSDSDSSPQSKTFYIGVFPHGIRVDPCVWKTITTVISSPTIPDYRMPKVMRNGWRTVETYHLDANGLKQPTSLSNGIIYKTTPFTGCSSTAQYHLQLILGAPQSTKSSSTSSSDQCRTRTTSQYRCVPFNQHTDLNGEYVVPGNKTLKTILDEQGNIITQENQEGTAVDAGADTTIFVGKTIAIVLGGAVALAGLVWIVKKINASNTS
jgi:hypothetical protein